MQVPFCHANVLRQAVPAVVVVGTLKVVKLKDDQWNVIWLPLSEDIVHALYKYVQTGEKSTYPFFMHFFDTFLRLSGHNGLTRSLAEGGQSQESPANTPDKGEASKDNAAPKDKAPKEGEGSADVAGSRNQALPQGTDPASLKALHEEEIRLGDVGGSIEFVFSAGGSQGGRLAFLVAEIKKDLKKGWEAHACQLCAQLYTLLAKNFVEHQHQGPVYGLLTDLSNWVLFEVRPAESLQPGQSVKAVISYSSVKSCFSQDTASNFHIVALEDVKDVVAFIAALFVADIHTKSGQWLQERLDTYTTRLDSAAEKFRSSKTLRLTTASRKRNIDECV
ncbi:hypothetical protein WJX75_000118 [Coccomyxa subellipsoidea]|uniref:Uncharacterized protein n=1 Tax=Coccomyxa subellipsoidea TaxID=248742 RepID=A0ABR2YII5_9CHLO